MARLPIVTVCLELASEATGASRELVSFRLRASATFTALQGFL